jgi:hypothetical protein
MPAERFIAVQPNAQDEADNEAEVSHSLLKFERHTAPLLPRPLFYRRVALGTVIGFGLLSAALFAGMIGYHITEKMPWLDAFANAAMILSGMGPLSPIQTSAGKLFAGCYALFSGLAFITIAGVVLGPFVHRLFHRFLLADDQAGEKDSDG